MLSAMRKWWPLVAVCAGTFMLLIDVTIVNVALPDIAESLGTSFDQLQWVVDVYALALAALVLGAGSLADLYGRRRLYLGGLVLFAVSSLACGLAPNAGLLITARAVQGIGAAAMFSTTIALLNAIYRGKDRGTAFGIWGAVVGAAAAAGPILGGLLTELSWRWIFLVNLPISLFAVLLTLKVVEESKQRGAPHPDVPGIAAFTLGAGAIVFGLVEAAANGWAEVGSWGPIVAGFVVLIGWVFLELRREAPMLDLRLFRTSRFSGIMIGSLLLNLAAFASSIYLSLWLQSILGLTPLQAGLVFIPLSAVSFVTAAVAGRTLTDRSPRIVLALGLVAVGAGALLMARVEGGASWGILVPGLAVLGLGVGICNPVVTSAALASVPRERSGMASGAVNTARQLGFAVGVAILGSVFASGTTRALTDAGAPDPAGTESALSSGQAQQLLGSVPQQDRSGLSQLLAAAYADGLRDVLLVSGAAGLVGALLVVLMVRGPSPQQGHGGDRRQEGDGAQGVGKHEAAEDHRPGRHEAAHLPEHEVPAGAPDPDAATAR
ncbi:drug resistance transporter, EmrB/QacA subfamily [Klenkia soli]|uniref:Drug resistance transporter, EmrB/QacA subfamily n=1 Tax=Klenkia soli TaxID=1052260 RepID=A0A1H0T3K8_9ACTN|nr:MFS transporter [Klenkia soli]SDP48128.1 drug resistance transporter, EmrB/QacA subfamily [Klenkia soli]